MCSKLDLHSIMLGEFNASGLTYHIEPGEHDREVLHEWVEECSLCRLVYDLDQHWSDRDDDDQPLEYDGHMYWYACGRNGPDTDGLNLEVLADWGESQSTFFNDYRRADVPLNAQTAS